MGPIVGAPIPQTILAYGSHKGMFIGREYDGSKVPNMLGIMSSYVVYEFLKLSPSLISSQSLMWFNTHTHKKETSFQNITYVGALCIDI